METISAKELAYILKTLNKNTLAMYLDNYRFSKYRITPMDCANARYLVNNELLNNLYNLFVYKNKISESECLKKYFKDYDLKLMKYEDFIK